LTFTARRSTFPFLFNFARGKDARSRRGNDSSGVFSSPRRFAWSLFSFLSNLAASAHRCQTHVQGWVDGRVNHLSSILISLYLLRELPGCAGYRVRPGASSPSAAAVPALELWSIPLIPSLCLHRSEGSPGVGGSSPRPSDLGYHEKAVGPRAKRRVGTRAGWPEPWWMLPGERGQARC